MIVNEARIAAALPAYALGEELGAGAFGLVLAGRHRRLNRQVAIKILSATHESASADFVAEARVLAGLNHPHVVQIYDYVEHDGLFLIVMELLAGGTLTRRRTGLPPEDACAVGLAVAEALNYAHAQGVLHRDIKLDNVLFDADDLLKVADFGISKIFEGSAASSTAVVGTPKYMAPEQITGGRLGPATDLYALGIVLYELLSGAPPFDPALPLRTLWQHHLDTVPTPPAGVPTPIADVILRALAKDPAARQPSAQAFALDLAAAATRSYGPRWTTRSTILLRLSDEVRHTTKLPPPGDPPAGGSTLLGPSSTTLTPLQPPAADTSPPDRQPAASREEAATRTDFTVGPADPGSIATLTGETGHTGAVGAVAFSPDGRVLATGSADHTTDLWAGGDPGRP